MKRLVISVATLFLFLPSVTFSAYVRPNGSTYFQTRSAAKLGLPSEKLDTEFNEIATYINALSLIQNASEWSQETAPPTYVSATSFYVSGDLTAVYAQHRRIKANLTGTYVYTSVSSSSYNGGTNRTTVVVADSVLTNQLSQIFYGILNSTSATTSVPANLNADTVDTYHASTAPGANKIPVADGSGKINTGWYETFPSGTRIVFFQASCPSGWNAVTVTAGSVPRIVANGAGGGTGGTHDVASPPSTAHTHTGPSHTHTVPYNGWSYLTTSGAGILVVNPNTSMSSATADNTTGAGGTNNTSSNGPTAFSPLYANMIVCEKP